MLCLKVPTDAAWAEEALRDVDAVLIDHAHCEMKAASNALSLAARHPSDAERVMALTGLAREEIEHFQRVFSVLVERGVELGPPPVDAYAAELRRVTNELPRDRAEWAPLVDRLLVGARHRGAVVRAIQATRRSDGGESRARRAPRALGGVPRRRGAPLPRLRRPGRARRGRRSRGGARETRPDRAGRREDRRRSRAERRRRVARDHPRLIGRAHGRSARRGPALARPRRGSSGVGARALAHEARAGARGARRGGRRSSRTDTSRASRRGTRSARSLPGAGETPAARRARAVGRCAHGGARRPGRRRRASARIGRSEGPLRGRAAAARELAAGVARRGRGEDPGRGAPVARSGGRCRACSRVGRERSRSKRASRSHAASGCRTRGSFSAPGNRGRCGQRRGGCSTRPRTSRAPCARKPCALRCMRQKSFISPWDAKRATAGPRASRLGGSRRSSGLVSRACASTFLRFRRRLGAASFARALGALGFAVRIAAAPAGAPFCARARARIPRCAPPRGCLRGARGGRRVAGARAGRRAPDRAPPGPRPRAHGSPRLAPRSRAVAARGRRDLRAPRDLFDELGPRLFGSALDARLRGAWPGVRLDEPARFLARDRVARARSRPAGALRRRLVPQPARLGAPPRRVGGSRARACRRPGTCRRKSTASLAGSRGRSDEARRAGPFSHGGHCRYRVREAQPVARARSLQRGTRALEHRAAARLRPSCSAAADAAERRARARRGRARPRGRPRGGEPPARRVAGGRARISSWRSARRGRPWRWTPTSPPSPSGRARRAPTTPARRSSSSPAVRHLPSSQLLLGRPTMAGVVVHVKEVHLRHAYALGDAAALRIRSLLAPARGRRERRPRRRRAPRRRRGPAAHAREGAARRRSSRRPRSRAPRRPSAARRPTLGRCRSLSCRARPKRPAVRTIAPAMAVRHPSDDLCVRWWFAP